MIKVVELSPGGATEVRHFEEQAEPEEAPRERRVTVQESGNLYRIKHGIEQSKPTLRLGRRLAGEGRLHARRSGQSQCRGRPTRD